MKTRFFFVSILVEMPNGNYCYGDNDGECESDNFRTMEINKKTGDFDFCNIYKKHLEVEDLGGCYCRAKKCDECLEANK